MKYRLVISSLVTLICAVFISAQTQQGIVKTKGRMDNNGAIIVGSPISDAYVTVLGTQTVTSNKDGKFSVGLKSKEFYLKEVAKEGYVLCDADILSRSYTYSSNPLYIVMETPAQRMEDKLLAERKLRRTLQRQLAQREEQIDSLKTIQQISDEEYRQQLQQIYADQEENERLIKEMADRYASIDYDQLDEYNRQISTLILEGKLTEADSLIRTKGDISSRIESLKEHQEKNHQEEQALTNRMKALEKSKAYTQKEMEDLAQDCYSLYEIFKMQHKNDSAAYYLELRASLDTTNVEWQYEIGDFFAIFMAKYQIAENYYKKMQYATHQSGDDILIGNSYLKWGQYYNIIHNFQNSLLFLDSAECYFRRILGEHSLEIVAIYNQKGIAYGEAQLFDKSTECYEKSLEILKYLQKEHTKEAANVHMNIGSNEIQLAHYAKAEESFNRAKEIFEQIGKGCELEYATILYNFGVLFGKVGSNEKSLQYYKEALSLRKEILGEFHPLIASSMHNIGVYYSSVQDYDSAMVYYQKALSIYDSVLGSDNPQTLKSLFSVGSTYLFMNQDSIGEEILLSCLEKYRASIGVNNSDVADIYSNLISICIKRKQYGLAKEYLILEDQIIKNIYGENHPNYAVSLAGFADIYDEIGDYQSALEYYEKAYLLLKAFLQEEHPAVQLMKSQINVQLEKLQIR